MDQGQFTTTFIPKKPLMQAPTENAPISRPVGLLSSVTAILFFVTILIGGGVYFWKSYETSNLATLQTSVTNVSKDFEPQLITQLQSLDIQLKNANTLVGNHTVISPIFDMLEASTLPQVQFSKFSVAFDASKGVQVTMSGVADGYQSIAEQSDVLGANAYLTDVIFSNFSLTQAGQVSFDLSFGVQPQFLNFQTAPLANTAGTTATTASTAPVALGAPSGTQTSQ